MSTRSLLSLAVKTVGIVLAGLMLATVTGCKSSPSSLSTSEKQATSTSAPVSTTSAAGSPEKGKELFSENCTTCHGVQGQGVPHLGADLQKSKFVASSTDTQLVGFIEQGRSASDPANTMHVAMPPKGGNPALTPQDLYNIVAFLRQIQRTRGER